MTAELIARNAAASPVHRRRRYGRRILFRGVAGMLALVVACLIGEVALRAFGYGYTYVNPLHSFHQSDPLIGYRGKPNFSGRFRQLDFDVLVEHDEQGFRKQEHAVHAEGAPRLFAFGDSFTWGWGVAQGEVYTDQLSLRMPGWSVFNRGVSASGTIQQFRIFESEIADTLRPGDVVLLAAYWNDFADNEFGVLPTRIVDGQMVVEEPTALFGSQFKDRMKDRSYLFNLGTYCADLVKLKWRERMAAQIVHQSYGTTPDGRGLNHDTIQYQVMRDVLGRFQRKCRERQARFLVVCLTGQAELGENQESPDDHSAYERTSRGALFDCAAELQLEILDLLPEFLAMKNATPGIRFTFRHDSHWNTAGHALAADVIARHLKGDAYPALPAHLVDLSDPPVRQAEANVEHKKF